MGASQSIGFQAEQVPKEHWPQNKTYLLGTKLSVRNETPSWNELQLKLAHKYVGEKVYNIFNPLRQLWNKIDIQGTSEKKFYNYDGNEYVEFRYSNVNHEKSIEFVLSKIRGTDYFNSCVAKGMSEKEIVFSVFPKLNEQTFGVFAKKNISAGTYFAYGNECLESPETDGYAVEIKPFKNIDKTINDLNFYYFQQEYEYADVENIQNNTNVKTVVVNDVHYLVAIKDIQKDEELSRYYGPSYWFGDDVKKNEYVITNWSTIYEQVQQQKIEKKERNEKAAQECREIMKSCGGSNSMNMSKEEFNKISSGILAM